MENNSNFNSMTAPKNKEETYKEQLDNSLIPALENMLSKEIDHYNFLAYKTESLSAIYLSRKSKQFIKNLTEKIAEYKLYSEKLDL